MGKKKPGETDATSKTKVSGKDISQEGKKEKLSVLEMLSSIDQKPDKPKKGGASSSVATSSKTKTKSCTKRVILHQWHWSPSLWWREW